MQALHVVNLEKYIPSYRDRAYAWIKLYCRNVFDEKNQVTYHAVLDDEALEILDEVNRYRLISLILREVYLGRPVPMDNKNLAAMGWNVKTCSKTRTINVLRKFLQVCNTEDVSTDDDRKTLSDANRDENDRKPLADNMLQELHPVCDMHTENDRKTLQDKVLQTVDPVCNGYRTTVENAPKICNTLPGNLLQTSRKFCNTAKRSEAKRSEAEAKGREEKRSEAKIPNVLDFDFPLRFVASLRTSGLITAKSASDVTTLRSVAVWVQERIRSGEDAEAFVRAVLDHARTAHDDGDKPIALFLSLLQREMGYRRKP